MIRLLINLLQRMLLSAILLFGMWIPSFGSGSDDGLLTQNKYTLYRLLLTNQDDISSPLYPQNWQQKCTELHNYPFLAKNHGFFNDCASGSELLKLSDIQVFQSYNTTHPAGMNDGAIWQGVGYNTAVTFGGEFNWKFLRVAVNPVIGFSQNKPYDLHPYPYPDDQPYSYWLRRIDYVQRYGGTSYQWIDPGYSEIELSLGAFHTGLSTVPFMSGPGINTSLLYSYNAAGIPRFFIGTKAPASTPIGKIGVNYFYGFQQKSDYFDLRTNNRLLSVHNLNVQFTPRFYQHITVGFNRTFQETYPNGFKELTQDVLKMFKLFSENSFTRLSDEDWSPDNQLFTFYLHWIFPDQNFELYGEWGRDDHGVDLDELYIQPEHSRAYLFGGQKSFNLSNNRLLGVGFELTHMDTPRSTLVRGRPDNPFGIGLYPWGTHGGQTIGMTNKGQLLGNGFGLGSNVRSLRINYLDRNSFTLITFNKITHNPLILDDPRVRRIVYSFNDTFSYAMRMTEFLITLHHTRTVLNGTEIGVGLDLSYTLHRYHISKNNAMNARVEFTVKQPLRKFW